MDEPLFKEENGEKEYFAHCYGKIQKKLPLDWHEGRFLVELLKRTQKLCLQARIERDRQAENCGPQPPSAEEARLSVGEATRRIQSIYCAGGKRRPGQ